jgi:hypothetical protein
MRADMDKQVKAAMASGFNAKQQSKLIHSLKNETKTLAKADLSPNDTLYFKQCSDCEFVVDAMCTKIFIEGCQNLKIKVNERVITQTLEVWKCDAVDIDLNTKIQTVQLDLIKGARVNFSSKEHFNRLIWSAVDDLRLTFADASEHVLETGVQQMLASNANLTQHDQFIVRLVPNKLSGQEQLLNEVIVRLENGFPTTEREARVFEERQEQNLQKLAKELLGKDIVLGKKKDDKPKVGRNDSCTCGSGKKFKKCCGTEVF